MALVPPQYARFTAQPGVFGNLILVTAVFVEGAPDLVVTVLNGTGIVLTIGLTAGLQNLNWDAIAAGVNADPIAGALAFAEGTASGAGAPPEATAGPLAGGAAGLGAGQFFFALAAPPEPAPPLLTLCFKGKKVYA